MDIHRTNPPGVHQPTGYSHAVRVSGGDLLVISGQVALDTDGQLVGRGDLGSQARQVFENLKTILAGFGADFSNVIKVTIFVVNYKPSDREILVKVRDQYVDPEHPFASTLLGVQSLARRELLIEIEALAVVGT